MLRTIIITLFCFMGSVYGQTATKSDSLLLGEWRNTHNVENGVKSEVPAEEQERLTFKSDYTFSNVEGSSEIKGKWAYDEKSRIIKILDSQGTVIYRIYVVSLNEKELIVRDAEDVDGEFLVHCVKVN